MSQLRINRFAVIFATAAFALGVPLGIVLASHQFSDVPNSNPFHADIDALADSGVTSGCGNGKYCPKDGVTREQMAAFLNRLGALGPGKTPVVNADKLDGLDSRAFERSTSVIAGLVDYGMVDTRVLLDPRTGADVRTRTSGNASVRIVNTSGTQRLVIAGMSTYHGTAEPEFANLGPGEIGVFNTETSPSTYLDLFITLAGVTASQTQASHLTCSTSDAGSGASAWVSCVLVG